MKNVFLALLCIVYVNLYSFSNNDSTYYENFDSEFAKKGLNSEYRTVVNIWSCDDTVIILYSNSTCDVGELTYNIQYLHNDLMALSISGKRLLLALFADNDNTLIMRSTDDENDIRHFTKCKKNNKIN
jgi:hypothetical protein